MRPLLNFVLVLLGVFSVLIGIGFLFIIPISLVSPYINQNRAFSLSGTELVSLLFVASLLFILSFFLFRFSKTSWDKSDLKNWKLWVLVIIAGFLSEPVGRLFGSSGPRALQSALVAGMAVFIAIRHRANQTDLQDQITPSTQTAASIETTKTASQLPANYRSTDPIVIQSSRKTSIIYGVVSGMFIIGLILLALTKYQQILSDPVMILIAILFIIGSPLILSNSVYQFLRTFSLNPLFSVSTEGIYDNIGPQGLGMIKWSEIQRVFSYTTAMNLNQKFLGIVPKDWNAILNRQSLFKRISIFYMRLLNVGSKTPISITEIALGLPVDRLINSMPRYLDGETKKTIQFG